MYADLGPGLEAVIAMPSTDGTNVIYGHEYVARRMRMLKRSSARYPPAAGLAVPPGGTFVGPVSGLNQFAYVSSQPVNLVDPAGLRQCENAASAACGCSAHGPLATNIPFPELDTCVIADALVKSRGSCPPGYREFNSCGGTDWCLKCTGSCVGHPTFGRRVCRPSCTDDGGVTCECFPLIAFG